METLISSNLTEAISWTILHSVWQGTLVSLFLMLCMKLMKNNIATQRYFMALSALFSILLMSVITFISVYRPESQTVANPDLSELVLLNFATFQASEKTWEDYLSQGIQFANTYASQISLLWIIGVTLLSIRFLVNLFYVHQLKTYKVKPASVEWEGRLKAIAQKINIHRQIKLVESALVEVPTVVGWLKPAILFPLGMFTALPPHEIESILAHELAHIRRNDFIINILQSIVEIVFFYHPAVWYISKHIENERENCCDDVAVAVTGDSLTYIKALTNLATLKVSHLSPALAITGKNGGLLQRVNRIARNAKLVNRWARQHTISPKLTAAMIVMMSVLLLVSKTEATTYLVEKLEKTPLEFLVKPFENESKEKQENDLKNNDLLLADTTKKAILKQITINLDSLGKTSVITLLGDTLKLSGVGKNTFFNINGDSLGQGILFVNPSLAKIRIPLDKFEIDTIESKFGNICTYKIKGLDSLNTSWSWLHDGNNLVSVPTLKKMNASQIDSLVKGFKTNGKVFHVLKDSLRRGYAFISGDSTMLRKLNKNNSANRVIINANSPLIVTGRNSNENPLYVIDGEAILPKNKESNLASIRNLTPQDIASISILKGNNATDKYGENGKEGVIEITTKKGNKDKNNSQFSVIIKDDKQGTSNNVTLNLQGKSDNVTLNIHDKSEIKKPLFVVDGKALEGEEGKEFLKNMDAREVESVSVLKEASATTIYGEKGKNGVVIITTKKGASNFKKEEKEPLYIIDGKEVSKEEYNSPAIFNDIVKVEYIGEKEGVKKYGEKGKYGVRIVYTTKTMSRPKPEDITQGLRIFEPQSLKNSNEVLVYPNPSQHSVNIKFFLDRDEPVLIEAHDAKGQKVATIFEEAYLNRGQNNFLWDTSKMASGSYIITLKIGATFSHYKVILD
jgi:TonB-dependent SusC/RagA subfamily outer membrane receptor